jgi:hypothetical protein
LATEIAPETAPAVFGSNSTSRVAVFPACRVRGKETPETEKPVPDTAAELIVTASVPLEVSTTDCVAGELRSTFPKATLEVLTESLVVPAAAGSNTTDAVLLTPEAEAVIVAVCAVDTAVEVAVKAAELEPLGTVTDAGTFSELLLLARLTAKPLVPAAAVRDTVQASVAAPVSEPALQETPLRFAGLAPVPLKATVAVPSLAALLMRVSVPESVPAVVGSNAMSMVSASPGFSVIGSVGATDGGRVSPEIANLLPDSDPLVITREAVPDEVTVTDFELEVLRATLPKLRLVALSVMSGVVAALAGAP